LKTFRFLFAGLLALAVLATPLVAAAQTQEVEIIDPVDLSRFEEGGFVTMLVEFRNFTEGIDAGQVVVTEDGQPVTNMTVSSVRGGRVPVGIVLVIDTSGSMAGAPLAAAQDAARQFVNEKAAEDYVALVTFSDTAQVLTGFTQSKTELTNQIDGLESSGETALFDGVILGASLYAAAAASLKPNMIVLGDGDDTVSTGTLEQMLAAVAEKNIRAFGVALESPDFNPAPLSDLATSANGFFLSTPDPTQLTDLYGQIQRELSNVVVVRFISSQYQVADVEFGVQYAGVTATKVIAVGGYPTTTAPTTTVPPTFVQAQPQPIRSRLPLPAGSLLLIATVAAGVTVALFLFILFGNKPADDPNSFGNRLQAYGRKVASEEGRRGLLARIPLLRRFTERAEEEVRKRGMFNAVNSALEQANIPLAPGEAIAASLGLAAVIGALFGLFNGSVIAGVLVFAVMVLLLVAGVNFIGGREKHRFEDQLPDTLTLLSTSLRAGYSLLQAVEAVAAEAPQPTSREFGRSIAESRLGRPVVAALQGITDRMQSEDFAWAVMAIEIQREVGGNLAEVLQTVADTMLQRNRLRREIKALTAEGRISAVVLGLLPFAMALFLVVSNPDYLEPLITTTGGIIAIVVGGLLMIAGGLWLRKIVNIEV
jgi:tight adherence protein B